MKRPFGGRFEVDGGDVRRIVTIAYGLLTSGWAITNAAMEVVHDRFRTVLVVYLATFLATFYTLRLWAWDRVRADLLARDASVVAARPVEVVVVQARIGAIVGLVLATIVVGWLAREMLFDRERSAGSASRRAVVGFCVLAPGLFVAGIAVAYIGLIPVLLDLLVTNAIETGFRPTYSIARWTSFVVLYSAWVGLGALLPLVMGTTTSLGVVSHEAFRRRWPYALVGIVVLSSVLNWSIDPLTISFAAVPPIIAYGVGLGSTKVVSTWRFGRAVEPARTADRSEGQRGQEEQEEQGDREPVALDPNPNGTKGDTEADPSLNDAVVHAVETTVSVANALSGRELTAPDLFEYGRRVGRLLETLRRSVVHVGVTFVLVAASVFTALHWGGLEAISRDLRARLSDPAGADQLTVVSLYPTEVLGFEMKVSVALGVVLTIPLGLYHAWPALRRRGYVRGERRAVAGWIGVFGSSFVAVTLLSYVLVAPSVVAYFLENTIEANVLASYQLSELYFLVFFSTVGVGLIVEIPLTLVLFGRVGFISYRTARRYWVPVAVAVLFLVSPLTQGTLSKLVVAAPFVLAYGIGLRALRTRFVAGPGADPGEASGDGTRPLVSLVARWIPARNRRETGQRFAVVLTVGAIVGALTFAVGEEAIVPVWDLLLPAGTVPQAYTPLALLVARLKVALLVAVVAAFPVGIHQVYRYRSARRRVASHERRWYLVAVPTSLVLALFGAFLSLSVVLPVLFTYLLTYARPVAVIAFGLTSTFGVVISLVGFFALAFQIPLVVLLAIATGTTTRSWFLDRRLYVWGALGATAFALSPDPTGVAPTMLAVVAIALFESGLVLSLAVRNSTDATSATSST